MKILAVSKVEQVRREILSEIVRGNLQPGQRLFEAKLAKELGVSQATLNAALQDLHNQGLVTKILNRSTNVSQYTLEDIEKLFSVRLVLEPAAAEAVAASWSDESEACLLEQLTLLERGADAPDIAKWCLADYSFHQEVYRLTGNPFLIQAGQAIAAAPFAYILCGQLRVLPTDYPAMAEEHRDIIDAMRQGPEAAGRTTRDRIVKWLNNSRTVLQSGQLTGALAR